MAFDPDWTLEQAKAAQAAWEQQDDFPPIQDPFLQWVSYRCLQDCERSYQQGDKSAILDAISFCLTAEVGLPDWLRIAFQSAHSTVKGYEVSSWDDVFGRPVPPGKWLKTLHQERHYPASVYFLVQEMRKKDPKVPEDNLFWEDVGAEFGVGRETAKKLYNIFLERFPQE